MKSIFSVIIFIILAVIFSQPEKNNTTKYIPLSFSFSQEINSSLSSNLVQVKFSPNNENKSYSINFDKKLNLEIIDYKLNFNFADCKITRRPQLGVNCNKESSHGNISSINLQPIYAFGKTDISDYLLIISYTNTDGISKKLKYLFNKSNLNIGLTESEIKVSQNN